MRIFMQATAALVALTSFAGAARAQDTVYICKDIVGVSALFDRWRKGERVGNDYALFGCRIEALTEEPKYWVSGEKESLPAFEFNANVWILNSRPDMPFAVTTHITMFGWAI